MTNQHTPGGGKPFIQHKDYLLVTVPEGTHDVFIDEGDPNLVFFCDVFGEYFGDSVSLPPGSWQLIGLASEITEEQWREIVDWYGVGDGSVDEAGVGDIFWCYDESDFCFDTAIKSGKSLLKYHNLNGNQTVILKLIEA